MGSRSTNDKRTERSERTDTEDRGPVVYGTEKRQGDANKRGCLALVVVVGVVLLAVIVLGLARRCQVERDLRSLGRELQGERLF